MSRIELSKLWVVVAVMQKLGLVLLGFALLVGCAPVVAPTPASGGPTVVARPPPPHCNEGVLGSVTPWSGRILERRPKTLVSGSSSHVIRTEWVLCGELDQEQCTMWAEAAAKKRVADSGLEFHVSAGRADRGRVWMLDLDGEEQAVLAPDNQTFMGVFRRLREDGRHPVVRYSDRIFEARFGRVEIKYSRPGVDGETEDIPAAGWLLEMNHDPESVLEALLALEDLEPRGVTLDLISWNELRDLARTLTGGDRYGGLPKLGATGTPQEWKARNTSPLQVWVEAQCARSY